MVLVTSVGVSVISVSTTVYKTVYMTATLTTLTTFCIFLPQSFTFLITTAGAAQAALPVDKPISPTDYSHFNSKLTINDFDLLKVTIDNTAISSQIIINFLFQVLGKGSFGKVMLVKKKDDPTGQLYALKTLRKAALVKRNQLAHTSTERTILQRIHNPFLVHLQFAFQTTDKLYMVLDFMAGGEIFFWLKKEKKFSENRSRMYAAEIVLALEALHSADIVYRDLKPENILYVAYSYYSLHSVLSVWALIIAHFLI